ncbi:hypothetical protein [Plantactinospora sp. KBS50]|uniref:hypothetical protein n=1 Tax=Plantactinospora sp. KBS50 TaxID=2024580 RepID=UPI001E537AC8|nr:hypothetical protein [Plantactinospora sp. KBS50]
MSPLFRLGQRDRSVLRPRLGRDPERNRRVLQEALDGTPGGTLLLPAGRHELSAGLVVPAGWTVRGPALTDPDRTGARPTAGEPLTWLAQSWPDERPMLHVLGSGVRVADVGLEPAPAHPGEHGGDRGTAVTVGRYLYDEPADWVRDVEIRGVHVRRRPGDRTANSIALMGAVAGVTVRDVSVTGGYTAVAVHWGAVGSGVEAISGPSYHPHRLHLGELRVRDAIEGFYLSSVHDVTVSGACLRDVQMGFRLLPGDNTTRFAGDPETIGRRIEIADVCVRWTGEHYAVRIAGWGRSEVDGQVSVLRYADTVVRDCVLRRAGGTDARSWAPLLLERAAGVALRGIRVESADDGVCCPRTP